MGTHRVVATSRPSNEQVELVTALLTGALAVLAREATRKGATEKDVRALIADEHAAITEALYGQPTTESRARMVARAVEVVGCRVEVVPC